MISYAACIFVFFFFQEGEFFILCVPLSLWHQTNELHL